MKFRIYIDCRTIWPKDRGWDEGNVVESEDIDGAKLQAETAVALAQCMAEMVGKKIPETYRVEPVIEH